MADEHNQVIGFETISTYSSEQAVEDGILFDITTVNHSWREKSIFEYVTTSLIAKGYGDDILYLAELLNQALRIAASASNGFKDAKEAQYSGNIELPNGEQQEIFIGMNEHGKYTIMIREDL